MVQVVDFQDHLVALPKKRLASARCSKETREPSKTFEIDYDPKRKRDVWPRMDERPAHR